MLHSTVDDADHNKLSMRTSSSETSTNQIKLVSSSTVCSGPSIALSGKISRQRNQDLLLSLKLFFKNNSFSYITMMNKFEFTAMRLVKFGYSEMVQVRKALNYSKLLKTVFLLLI